MPKRRVRSGSRRSQRVPRANRTLLGAVVVAVVAVMSVGRTHADPTPLEQLCFDAVQGKVAFDREGNRSWSDFNVRALCQGTSDPAATIACFEAEIRSSGQWQLGLQKCKSAATNVAGPVAAATPSPAGQAASSAFNATGRTAEFVDFGWSGTKQGEYRQTALKQWVEQNNDGKKLFGFEETKRDDASVYLLDRSRGVSIQLDLLARKVMYSHGNSALQTLYDVLGARPTRIQATGRTATLVEFVGTHGKPGEYRQVGPGQWLETWLESGTQARLDEVRRDDSSVYLVRPSQKINLQLDLVDRKVMYEGKLLYPVTAAAAPPVPQPSRTPAGQQQDCAYVIAAVERDGGLRFLRAPAGANGGQAVANREAVGKTDAGAMAPDSFWALVSAGGSFEAVPPFGKESTAVSAFYVVSLETGGVLRLDQDRGTALVDYVSPYVRDNGWSEGYRPFLFVPVADFLVYRLGLEVREYGTNRILTLDDRSNTPATYKPVTTSTETLFSSSERAHYRRSFAVFSPNCPEKADAFSGRTKGEDLTRPGLKEWGLDGDTSVIAARAAAIYRTWPLPYYELYRGSASQTVCPTGMVAVGFGCAGDRCERRTLVCRSYQGLAAQSTLAPGAFPIADQGDGTPRKGDQLAPGALNSITCADNRQCVVTYLQGFLDSSPTCREMNGPDMEYWDYRVRDQDGVSRDTLPDKYYRPFNEVWCDGEGEVLAGFNCPIHLDAPQTQRNDPYCRSLGLRCCKAPAARGLRGRLYSPWTSGSQLGTRKLLYKATEERTTVWSALYGYASKLPADGANPLEFTCPKGHVASAFDCGNDTKACDNKAMGCKRLGPADDSKRMWSPRKLVDKTGGGAFEPNMAVTGMRCATPTCRELRLQQVRTLNTEGAEHCRWAAVTNALQSSASECTAGEYLADIRCKDGNCASHVETKCCTDQSGRLAADRFFDERASPKPPPRVGEAVNEKQKDCRQDCDDNPVGQALKGCSIGPGDEACLVSAVVTLGCHAACAAAHPNP